MTYTKEQLWSMSSEEMNKIFQSHRIVAYYNDGKVLSGKFELLILASNEPYLPCIIKIENNQSINLMNDTLIKIEVL